MGYVVGPLSYFVYFNKESLASDVLIINGISCCRNMFDFGQKSSTSTEQGFLGSSPWPRVASEAHKSFSFTFFVVYVKYVFIALNGECIMNLDPYCWCFDYIEWMISLKSTRSWNCKSQGQKSWIYGSCLAFNSSSFLIPLGRFAPCDSHAIFSLIDSWSK